MKKITEEFIRRVREDFNAAMVGKTQISGYQITLVGHYSGGATRNLYDVLDMLARRGEIVVVDKTKRGKHYAPADSVRALKLERSANKTPPAYRPSVFVDVKAPTVLREQTADERMALAMMVRG